MRTYGPLVGVGFAVITARLMSACADATPPLRSASQASPPPTPSVTATAAPAPTGPSAAQTDLVARVAAAYSTLTRSDAIHWAPELCAAPRAPASAFVSTADTGAHAKKLYRLFIQDTVAYAAGSLPASPQHAAGPAPVFRETEQVIVKESWVPTLCKDGERGLRIGAENYCLQTKSALFVMARPLATERAKFGETDDGWIYGTFVDGAVTSAGRVETCMHCHTKAPNGRLFGLQN